MPRMNLSRMTTDDLVAEYDERIARRIELARNHLGSMRIRILVDEISRRADEGDTTALAWYDNA